MTTYNLQFVAVPSSASPVNEPSVTECHDGLTADAVIQLLDEAMDDGMDLVADLAEVYVDHDGSDPLLVRTIPLNRYGDAYFAQCVSDAIAHLEGVEEEEQLEVA